MNHADAAGLAVTAVRASGRPSRDRRPDGWSLPDPVRHREVGVRSCRAGDRPDSALVPEHVAVGGRHGRGHQAGSGGQVGAPPAGAIDGRCTGIFSPSTFKSDGETEDDNRTR